MKHVIGYYDSGNPIYIFKNNDGVALYKKHNLKNYDIFLLNNKNKYVKKTFWDVLKIAGISKIQYNSIIFNPEKSDLKSFNLWSGFNSIPIKNLKLIKPILHHINYVWASNKKERYNYIINWLANIIQKPWEKNGTVLVFIGAQGCGKNILCNFLMRDLIGKKYSATIKNLDKITSRFNSILEHKILITLDEVSNIEKNYHKTFDNLKNLITENRQQIERKGLDPITIDDFCNFIMLSNNYYPVKVEGMDRRYCIFDCSDRYVNNEKYFISLKESLNQNAANAFHHFLKSVDVSNLSDIPVTKIKEELIKRSIPSTLLFFKKICKKYDNKYLKSSEIWNKYCNYCNENYIKQIKKRTLMINISRYVKKKQIRENGKKAYFYICNYKNFKEKVKKIDYYIL
jgi:phage/plasmid-associated DNA primase